MEESRRRRLLSLLPSLPRSDDSAGMTRKRTAIVVPGHGRVDSDGVHRVSSRCLRLVHEAELLVSGGDADLVVFSGWSPGGERSEAEQMRDAWHGPSIELVAETEARNTAENAARTLPLLQERGITRAVVLSAPAHALRTRLLFRRLYRNSGIELSFRAPRLAPTLRSIAWELGALPFVPAQLRSARVERARRSR
jgi:uncharacterized SAM-binding protein YcdF (DUF218 family)